MIVPLNTQIAWKELQLWLAVQPPAFLADWLMGFAGCHLEIGVILQCEMHQAEAGGVDAKALKSTIEFLTTLPYPVTWRESREIGNRIDLLIKLLSATLARGNSTELRGLVKYALQRVETVVMEVQDSESWSSGALEELLKLHSAVCKKA